MYIYPLLRKQFSIAFNNLFFSMAPCISNKLHRKTTENFYARPYFWHSTKLKQSRFKLRTASKAINLKSKKHIALEYFVLFTFGFTKVFSLLSILQKISFLSISQLKVSKRIALEDIFSNNYS